ncbi:MAG: NnrU family protein [Inquilinaceae bacterium]
MAELLAASLFLLATHFGLSSIGPRDRLVALMGERLFRALYSAIAVAALVWLAIAYGRATGPLLWAAYPYGHMVTVVLLPIALILLIGGVSMPNPTAIGGAGAFDRSDLATGMLRVTRNPVMWAIGLWALSHLPPNGDLPSLVFFGTLAGLAVVGTVAIDAKNRRNRGAQFAPLELVTSNLPLLAIVQGRQSLRRALREFGLLRLAVAVVLYAALLHGHAWLFGVPAIA